MKQPWAAIKHTKRNKIHDDDDDDEKQRTLWTIEKSKKKKWPIVKQNATQ